MSSDKDPPPLGRIKCPPPDLIPQFELDNSNLSDENKSERDFRIRGRHGWFPRRQERREGRVETQRRGWTVKRGLCCVGWVVCFPIFCVGWMLREAPVDEEDIREDDCYPCYN